MEWNLVEFMLVTKAKVVDNYSQVSRSALRGDAQHPDRLGLAGRVGRRLDGREADAWPEPHRRLEAG